LTVKYYQIEAENVQIVAEALPTPQTFDNVTKENQQHTHVPDLDESRHHPIHKKRKAVEAMNIKSNKKN